MYTIEQIREKITPVAKEYGLRKVYLFGSYARREATEDSDVDLLVDAPYGMGLFKSEALRQSFMECLNRDVDIVHTECLLSEVKTDSEYLNREKEEFRKNIQREGVLIYERTG